MDLGFPTVKPDRKLIYMLAKLGYLNFLPTSITQKEATRSLSNIRVVKEVVGVGLKMAEEIRDSENPIRELDFLCAPDMVITL